MTTISSFLKKNIYNDKEIVLVEVKDNGNALEDVHDDFTKDKEIVLEAVKQNGYALYYAHDDLTKDKEIVLEAVKQNGNALKYAHDDLKKDKKIIRYAIDETFINKKISCKFSCRIKFYYLPINIQNKYNNEKNLIRSLKPYTDKENKRFNKNKFIEYDIHIFYLKIN